MYRLKVIAGPNSGTTFEVAAGETSIGRTQGNVIVLASHKVSKRHCSLVVDNTGVRLRDDGSANGTFVNGELVKQRDLSPGDRISVGEFTFELRMQRYRSATGGKNLEIVRLDQGQYPVNAGPSGMMSGSQPVVNKIPSDPKEKAIWIFERYVMPVFYGLNLKHDWKVLSAFLLGFLLIASMVLSVAPLLEANNEMLIKETEKRARFIAKQLADQNAGFLAKGQASLTQVDAALDDLTVNTAVLVDLENRILAPPQSSGKYFTTGDEALFASKVSKVFKKGAETGRGEKVNANTLVWIEPVKVFDEKLSKNTVVAMSVVSIDLSVSTLSFGMIGVIYSKAFFVLALLGVFFGWVLYRLTMKPLEMLNEDIDKVLKGEAPQVAKDMKWSETSQLWDVINSTLQRIPRSNEGSDSLQGQGGSTGNGIQDLMSVLGLASDVSHFGIVVCDENKQVISVNSVFEDITGIRGMEALGKDLSSVARDDAFGAMTSEILNKLAVDPRTRISEDFEFSGINYKIHGSAAGTDRAMGYVVFIVKADE